MYGQSEQVRYPTMLLAHRHTHAQLRCPATHKLACSVTTAVQNVEYYVSATSRRNSRQLIIYTLHSLETQQFFLLYTNKLSDTSPKENTAAVDTQARKMTKTVLKRQKREEENDKLKMCQKQ